MQLECGLCRVRSWQFGDEENLHTHANNRAIWLNLRDSFPFPYTQADAQRWIQYVVDPAVELNFALEVEGEAVGNIGLRFGEDIDRYSAEIWYWLGEAFWGKGIISAALRAFTDYAFMQYPLTRLYAMPYAHNLGSIKVLEKAGFQREGLLRNSAVKDGIVLDKVLYAYVSSDWLNAPANAHES